MTAPRATDKIIDALRAKGCDPQPLLEGWWLATCPCCGNRSLMVGPGGEITTGCEL
jgi:hypothetical protein